MDEADILKLDEAGLFLRQRIIIAKVKRIDEDDPTDAAGPRIDKLLAESDLIIERLDPIMRERYRDDPVKLAEWDEIIHSCDDLHEDAPTDDKT